MGDAATWAGTVAALVVGVIGWVLAGAANGRAKKANQLAAEANRHAEAAVAEAVEANRVAVAANKLAEDSNAVSHLEAARRTENHLAEWHAEWDADDARIVLTNDGPDAALDVTITINGQKIDIARRDEGDVPRRGQVVFAFPQLVDERIQYNREAHDAWEREMRIPGIISVPGKWRDTLEIIVRWRSELGQPHKQRLQLKVR